jgi:hypothetical protein
MGKQIHEMDRFQLGHATRRAEVALREARSSVNYLAEEFATLASRQPVPEPLQTSYRAIADVLESLKSAIEKSTKESLDILQQAREGMPPPRPHPEPGSRTLEAILRAARTVERAEAQARQVLGLIYPQLEGAPWSKEMAHGVGKLCITLDPGPDFQHYLLEDTDFNLLECPLGTIRAEFPEDRWTRILPGPLGQLGSHGDWLHYLDRAGLDWWHYPMIRVAYVDFDLGTGLEVPRK